MPHLLPNVFLSYARAMDVDLLHKLKSVLTDLRTQGKIELFIDEERLDGGDHWAEHIQQELVKAEIVVCALSPAYFKSSPCREELWTAYRQSRAFPILVEEVLLDDPDVPQWIRDRILAPRAEDKPRSIARFREQNDEDTAWSQVVKSLHNLNEKCTQTLNNRAEGPWAWVMRPIQQALKRASSFSLLTRTGQGWWSDFEVQFMDVLRDGDDASRVLVMNPDCQAFKASRPTWTPGGPDEDWSEYRERTKRLIDRISQESRLEVRVVDVYIPYSMRVQSRW